MIILKCVPHVKHAHFCRSANQILITMLKLELPICGQVEIFRSSQVIAFNYGLYPQA